MKSKLLLIATIALFVGSVFAETKTNDGAITDVIVYHGRALVTRTIQLEKAGGDVELLVENLPERILPESLYAQAADGIQVLSVRYRVKEEKTDTRAEVRAIDEQYEAIEKELHRVKRDNQLAYLVDGADWSPQYNLKALPEKNVADVEYNAVVHQASGEDWTNAELALSTAVPALVATPPTLEPLEITLSGAGPREYALNASRSKADMSEKKPEIQQQTQQSYSYLDQTALFYDNESQRRANIAKGIKANADLNFFATNNQMIEFEADKRLLQQIKEKAVAIQRAEGVSVMYRLPGRLTLPSKSDQQLVTIASIQCPAAFTFIAAPLLTDYVYLEGELTNTSDTILLPGSVDTFRNGEFVGKGDMKLVTIGQTFTAGFGVDSQIQVTREFKDKKIETLWGNRMDEHQYRLEIDNYKNTAVGLRLMDRLPWTENEALGIELTSNSHPLSTDAEYIRTQKDKGILRWDLNLKPNTHGKNATVVNYTFMMKYDNDMAIQNLR